MQSLLLLFVVGALLHLNVNGSNDDVNVAFVFAGGVRSFVLPSVHESIRYNLIHAFCPPSSCIADVFMRMSIDDNTHDGAGANAKGFKIEGGEQKLQEALRAIRRIVHDREEGKLEYDVVNIGSEVESEQMDIFSQKYVMHKIYRDLDPRRYSMYFNRDRAYALALKEELDSKKRYSWVVHARLDMAWGAPVRPHYVWSPEKLWVPDSWPSDVPDSFAIIPRKYADSFFLLNNYFEAPDAMCLGGPNFDPNTIKTEALQARGYNPEEIHVAQKDECMTKMDNRFYHLYQYPAQNITWTSAGFSEMLLKRKLAHFGVSRKLRTLGFTSFFTMMTRYPLNFVCYNVEPRRFIPMSEHKNPTETVGVGCYGMWMDMNHLLTANYAPNCDMSSEEYTSKYPLVNKPMSTCLIDKQMTDWNFMPFRFRRRGNFCLTSEDHPAPDPPGKDGPKSRAMGMRPCIYTIKKDMFTHFYDASQLFSLYPLSPLSYRITTFDFFQGQRCLTVSTTKSVVASGKDATPGNVPRLMVEMAACHAYSQHISQLFHVEIISKPLVSRMSGNFSNWDRSGSNTDPRGGGIGSETSSADEPDPDRKFKPLLADKYAVMIKWMGENQHYCVAYEALPDSEENLGGLNPDSSTTVSGSTIVTADGQQVTTAFAPSAFAGLGPCLQSQEWVQESKGEDPRAAAGRPRNGKANRNVVFVMERMHIETPIS